MKNSYQHTNQYMQEVRKISARNSWERILLICAGILVAFFLCFGLTKVIAGAVEANSFVYDSSAQQINYDTNSTTTSDQGLEVTDNTYIYCDGQGSMVTAGSVILKNTNTNDKIAISKVEFLDTTGTYSGSNYGTYTITDSDSKISLSGTLGSCVTTTQYVMSPSESITLNISYSTVFSGASDLYNTTKSTGKFADLQITHEKCSLNYVVSIWGIEQDGTNTVTFGPATGASNTCLDVGCGSEHCIHTDSWDEICTNINNGHAHYYDNCLTNNCSANVPITPNSTLFNTSAITSALKGSILYNTINSTYRAWNKTYSSSDCESANWATSRIRATLNGASGSESSYAEASTCLSSSNCLLSCFPSALQSNIKAKSYRVPTTWDTSSYSISAYTDVEDKLWLPNAMEVYSNITSSNYAYYYYSDSNYGTTQYTKKANEGTSTSSYSKNMGYNESGSSDYWWLRCPNRHGRCIAGLVYDDGDLYGSYVSDTYYGLSACFCLGSEDRKVTYSLNSDSNCHFEDGSGNTITSIDVDYGEELKVLPVFDDGYEADSITDDSGNTLTIGSDGYITISNVNHNGSVTMTSKEMQYLCFTNASTENADATIKFTNNGSNDPDMKYSYDGTVWTAWSAGTVITLDSTNPKIYVKGDNASGFSASSSNYTKFVMTGTIAASGNIMSLIDDGACNTTTIPSTSCYSSMFSGCTSLTTPPELPATTLANYCYAAMFDGCTSLSTPPELPATTLASGCYRSMFYGCTSLSTPPELPATTLADYCYRSMFYGCTSLKISNSSGTAFMKFTTTATSAVSNMFYGTGGTFTGDPVAGTQYYYCPDMPVMSLTGDSGVDHFENESAGTITEISGDYGDTIKVKPVFVSGYTADSITDSGGKTYTLDSEGYFSVTLEYNGSITVTSKVSFEGLCFTNASTTNADATIEFTNNGSNDPDMKYSYDGTTWTTWTASTAITLNSTNPKIYVKGDNASGFSASSSNYTYFVMTGSIAASGNIMSLLDDGACTTTTIPCNYCYRSMFRNCTSLSTPPELPATTLASSCYYYMFRGCTSLSTPPELPATTLATYCYAYMFYGCTLLSTPPELPATTLASGCYDYMFSGCTSLSTPPELPATTLATYCYRYMFYGCTSLSTPPELPATTLATYCYAYMFYGCTLLSTPPELPATTLASGCYRYMFYGCTSLSTPPELPATTLADYCYRSMFYGCTSLKISNSSGTAFMKFTTTATSAVSNMFSGTGGTFTDDPVAGTQYYYESPSRDVEIGTATSSNYNQPYNNYYKYSANQQIYLASELGDAGSITQISYNVASASSCTYDDLRVYMVHTSMSSFPTLTDNIVVTADDLVFSSSSGTLGSATGYETITLDTPFEYNGTDNLAIIVCKHVTSYNNTLKYYASDVSSRCMYKQNDSTSGYADATSTGTGSYAILNTLSDIKIHFGTVSNELTSVENIHLLNSSACASADKDENGNVIINTTNTAQNTNLVNNIENNEMVKNDFGEIIKEETVEILDSSS